MYDEDAAKWEWKKYDKLDVELPMMQPYEEIRFVAVGFDNIIFCEYRWGEEMYCIDLLYGKIFRSHKLIPTEVRRPRLHIVTKDNYVHFVDHLCIEIGDVADHLKIYLGDFIPKELDELYKERMFHPLVFGYIANVIKSEKLSSDVPIDVVNLILMFVPSFL